MYAEKFFSYFIPTTLLWIFWDLLKTMRFLLLFDNSSGERTIFTFV